MALIAILLTAFVLVPWYSSTVQFDGIEVERITEGLPADIAGIEPGKIITAMNGVPIVYVDNFTALIKDIEVGDTITLSSETEDYNLTTISDPQDEDRPFIGIYFSQHHSIKPDIYGKYGNSPEVIYVLIKFLNWVSILGLGIGMANLLPLGPLDGGRMLLVSLSRFFKKKTEAMAVWKFISMVCLFLLLANFILPHLI